MNQSKVENLNAENLWIIINPPEEAFVSAE